MQDYKDTDEENSAPTVEEVEMAVQKLKNCKPPGTDNIPAELFKYGENELVKRLHTIIKDIWQKKKDVNGMECEYNLPHT